jgi:hypothetical protein
MSALHDARRGISPRDARSPRSSGVGSEHDVKGLAHIGLLIEREETLQRR